MRPAQPFGGKGSCPKEFARADLTIATVYQEFALLSARYLTSPFGRLGLGLMDRGCALAALALDRPFALVGHDVLVPTGHVYPSIQSLVALGTKHGGN